MLHKLLLILSLSWSANAFAQDCTLKLNGQILDEHDKSSLDYATIYIAEIKLGITADSNGYYEFKQLCAGKYTFIIEHINCAPDTILYNFTKSTTKNFFLEHHAEELAEITFLSVLIFK